jgi:hypothetical protein
MTAQPVVFSAHGVPKAVPEEARSRECLPLDATCPLVTKVHREAEIHFRRGPGHHADRPCRPPRGGRHHGPVAAKARSRWSRREAMPQALVPRPRATWPIPPRPRCRSTTPPRSSRSCPPLPRHRRPAQGRHLLRDHQPSGGGEAVAAWSMLVVVVGAPNSSNSQRLREVAERAGCPYAVMVQRAAEIDWRRPGCAHARRHRRRFGAGGAGRGSGRPLLANASADGRGPVVAVEDVSIAFRCPAMRRDARSSRLAVYTDVPDEELRGVPARLRPRRAVSFKGIAEGVENSNYLLARPRSRRLHPHAVREAGRSADLPFFLGLMEHLARTRASPARTPVA